MVITIFYKTNSRKSIPVSLHFLIEIPNNMIYSLKLLPPRNSRMRLVLGIVESLMGLK